MPGIEVIPVRPTIGDQCRNNCVVILPAGYIITEDDAPPDGYAFVYANGQKVYVGDLPVLVPSSFANN